MILTHYIKISLRNLWRNKWHSLINISGLTLGVFCATFLFIKVVQELSYNHNIEDSHRIYRIVTEENEYGRLAHHAGIPYPASEALRTDFSQFEQVVMMDNNFTPAIIHVLDDDGKEINRFKEEEMVFVEPNYFQLINYDWIEGDKLTALNNPNSVVITTELAEKYFGTTEVMGKTLSLIEDSVTNYSISGIVKPLPKTTDFPFHLIFPFDMKRPRKYGMDSFNSRSSGTQVYVKLPESSDPSRIEPLFDDFIRKHKSEEAAENQQFLLQPLNELHYNEKFGSYGDIFPNYAILAISLIGIFLFITACINFINLNTALVFKRGKEIGLRKVLGSQRSQIISYFLVETGLIALFSWILAWGLAAFLFEPLSNWLGIGEWLMSWTDPVLWGFGIGIFFLLVLFAGLYPAVMLSNLSPVLALKNKVDKRYGKGLNTRKVLIVTQFAISQIMIICSLTAMKQIKFFREQPTGLVSASVVEVPLPDADTSLVFQVWRNKLNRVPGISSITYSNSGSTSNSTWSSNFYFYPTDTVNNPIIEDQAHMKTIDEHYFDTYGINLIAGNNIKESDSITAAIVNETFFLKTGAERPEDILGNIVKVWGQRVPIVGVVQDFTTRSLHNEIPAVVMVNDVFHNRLGIKLETANLNESLTEIERTFNEVFPAQIFEYEFLDETIEEFYESERIAFKVFIFAACVAIFIGCLGLFGLVSFMAERRTKEIGVRKVLGASIQQIMGMFSWEFAVLVIVGFVVSIPISAYILQSWLEEFAYRISLPIESFIYTFLFALGFMAITVGWKAWEAAKTNPVNALKDE